MSVLCIGDSLTYGKVGYSYIPYLKTSQCIINKGMNGDTTHHALKRLQRMLKSQKYRAVDTCIVSIGTNDTLLPYMTTISAFWNLQMKPRCIRMNCLIENSRFTKVYKQYISILKKYNKKIILIGLPYIQLQRYPHRQLKERNEIIRKLAVQYNCPFVDIYAIQCQIVEHPKIFSWKYRNMLRLIDSTMMTAFPSIKDRYEETRHLGLTVDGVHFSKTSAMALANAVEKYF